MPVYSAPSKDIQAGPILQICIPVMMAFCQVHQFLSRKWLNEQEKHLFVSISKILFSQFANTLSQDCDIQAQREHCQCTLLREKMLFCPKFHQNFQCFLSFFWNISTLEQVQKAQVNHYPRLVLAWKISVHHHSSNVMAMASATIMQQRTASGLAQQTQAPSSDNLTVKH